MRPLLALPRIVCAALTLAVCSSAFAQPARKIGELQLSIVGLAASIEPAAPVIPRNTPAGVLVVVRGGAGEIATADVRRFFGADVHVEADFTGPGLLHAASLTSAGDPDPLLLRLPAVQTAGDYQLSNIRLVAAGRPVLDVTPGRVPVQVIEQILITSVTTRPLTLAEIKAKGIVLDRDDYLAFEFTMGVKLESRAIQLTFPAVFTAAGVPLPEFTFANPQVPSPALDLPSLPMIVPTMLVIEAPGGGTLIPRMADGTVVDVRIPSVLVIPGNVGFLKQFFSAQLFVANGAPAGSGLTVRDLTGTIRLPAGDDAVRDTPDDPLVLATLADGRGPSTLPVLVPDGAPGQGTGTLAPGAQAQAEFLIRGEREGFHEIAFDIQGVLDGLVTGPATVRGSAKGAVLVRNPFFDMTFTVPSVVRTGEKFALYVTVTNKSESGPANDLTVALDQSRMSGMRVDGDAVRQIPTLLAGDARTLRFDMISERTGQVTATYIRFDPDAGASGQMRFTAGIGERGVALSPDTIRLPVALDALPGDLVEAAMRVIGQAWSISLATSDTRPAGVLPISRPMTIAKALALAETALRVQLGQELPASLRDFAADFYGPAETTLNAAAIDPGFDQLLRTTDAGHAFGRALGAALHGPIQAAGGVLGYQQDWASLLASGSDRITLATSAAPVDVAVIDGAGLRTESAVQGAGLPRSDVPSVFLVPIPDGGAETSTLGLITQPAGGPYTIELTGRGNGVTSLAVSLPRGDGTTARAAIWGLQVSAGSRARITLDPARPDALVLERDADGDGVFEAQDALAPVTLAAAGAQLLTFTVVGPEVLSSAGPYGKHTVLLFDRIIDPNRIRDTGLFQIPNNRVVRASRVLSGRLAVAELEQPEGPHVPTSLAFGGVADLRGVTGPASAQPLVSMLADPGAVVTGRVFTPDGAGVGGVDVFYTNSFGSRGACENARYGLEYQQAALRTGADGAFQVRWVRKDVFCGLGFRLVAQDPRSGSVRRLDRTVRADGEHIVLDFGLLGRGTVTGVVRDLEGQPAGGAQVIARSESDPHIQYSALADGEGRYTIPDVLVGVLTLRAAKAYDNGATVRQGTAAGRLMSAGGVASIDIVLDTGSAAVSGVVTHLLPGGATPVGGALVLYSVNRGGQTYQVAAGVLSDESGRFAFPSVPAGAFQVAATLATPLRETGKTLGFVSAGDAVENLNILVETPAVATIRGHVRLADGTLVARAMVRAGERFTYTDALGAFQLADLAVRPTQPHAVTAETPDRRKGSASVLLAQPGVVDNVVITLSVLGSAEFTLVDPYGAPVAGQEVVVLADSFGLRGACALGCGCAMAAGYTNAQGRVRFDDLPAGAVLTRAMRNAGGFVDVANGRTTIVSEGQLALGVMRFEGYGSITGLVLDDQARPSVGADVTVSSRRFDKNSCTLAPGPSYAVRTDHLGRFALPAVGVGPVSLRAAHPFLPVPVGENVAITRPGEEVGVTLRLVNSFAGELSGRILLPDGETPAGPGVEVTIYGPLPDITVRTDADGAFRFAKILPAGNYTMTATDPMDGATAREVVGLKAGQDLIHELRLKGRGTVRVRVVDALDVPVTQAVVRLTETAYPSRVLEGMADQDNGGVIAFDRVFEGPVAVEASDAHARGGRTSATLPGPGAEIEIKVRLSITGTIRGRFLTPDGTPIPYGVVSLRVGGREIGQATTAGSGDVGSFEFTHVPAGAARLEAQDPATARTGIAVGSITTEGEVLPLDVYAEGLGTVTGVVTAGAVPQPAAQIDLSAGQFKVKAVADGNGRYTIDGVPEGLVSVTARANGGIQRGSASAVLTGDGATLTIDVSVRDTGQLTGTVVTATGSPLPPVVVTAKPSGAVNFSATVDEDGRFDFPRLPAGSVVLTADVIGSTDTARLSLTLPGSTTTDVLLQLRGVGSLSGTALGSDGQPTGGSLTVHAGDSSIGASSIAVTVGPDGAFRFPELLAGPVSLKFHVKTGPVTLYGTAAAVVVPEQDTVVEVRLQDSATVVGLVMRSDGTTPAIGADAVYKLTPGPQVPVQVQADGSFTVTGVPLGAFTLSVTDPFTGGVALVRNQATTVNGEILDLGTIVLDDTPVAVTAVDPPDGSTGISVTRAVQVAFSDPLQSTAGVSVMKETSVLSSAKVLSADGLSMTLSPSSAGKWPDASEIRVVVSTSATDIFGRHPAQSFTSRFHTVDLSPPAVVSVLPAHQAFQVDASAAVQVTFNEPLGPATDLASLIVVTGPGAPIAGETVMTSPDVATFTPDAPLAANALYSVIVTGAEDPSGNRQTAAFTSSFATVDTIAPALALELPAGDWVSTARPYIQIRVTDNASGIDIATGTLAIDGAPVAVQYLVTALVYTPPADLSEGNHTVAATARDRAGNLGSLAFPLRIDTVAPDLPEITSLTAGQIVSGTIVLAATSADATSGLARIRFYRGSTFIGEATGTPFELAYSTTALAEGPHDFRAQAVDVAGNSTGFGPSVTVTVDNKPLTLTINQPSANTRVRDTVLVRVTPSEAVSRIDFTVGSLTVSDTTAPYEQTLDVTALPEGSVTITVTGYPVVGEPASKTVTIVADRTPPPAPDSSRIDAEPPVAGVSLVVGRAGAVEAGSRVEIVNTVTGAAAALATAASTGAFTSSIAGEVDDVLAVVAIDDVGNRSAASLVPIRRTPSLPPAEGTTALTFEGVIVDRVGPGATAVAPDGALDAVFTMTLAIGDGLTRQLSHIDLAGPALRSTRTAVGSVLGVAADAGAELLNAGDGEVSFTITSGATLTLVAADFGFIQEGATYTATAVFTDGSRFVGTYYYVPAADRARIAHSLVATAAPPTVQAAPGVPGFTTITLSDIRDLEGTRVPDGALVAVAVADMAAKDARGNPMRSAGGEILDGTVAPNNSLFRILPVLGGTVVATYSSAGIVPAPVTGTLAVVQVQGADADGNVLGTHIIGAMGINVRAAADQAIVEPVASSVYADTADRRVRVAVRVRQSSGAPAPDGTKVVVTAANNVGLANGYWVSSAGGSVFGGEPSPSGSNYRALTVAGGQAEFEYSAMGLSPSVGTAPAAVLQVYPAAGDGTRSSSTAIGTAVITLVGPGDAEIHLSPAATPIVFPPRPVQVRVHHVHDLWAGLVPDGAKFLLTASNNVLLFRSSWVSSAGGSIVDGDSSPSGSAYRSFTMTGGELRATYALESSISASAGETRLARIQVVGATPAGVRLGSEAVAVAPLTLVAPTHGAGAADPPSLLADGALHTSTVTFAPVIDAFGNPLPEGSTVVATAAGNVAIRDGYWIQSAGGQILNGGSSPSGSAYRVFTVENGAVSVLYGDQNITATPGQTKIANVSLLPADASGARTNSTAIGVAPVALAGLTSAEVAVSPGALHADGADRRASVTITNLRDAAGQLVPDGTLVGATANGYAAISADGCCWIQSAGGTIVGGTTAANQAFKIFPVVNGQVTFEYSSMPVSVASGEALAVVSVVAVSSNNAVISQKVIGTASIRLLALAEGMITASPVDVLADGAGRVTAIVVSGFTDTGGLPTPDGARIGLTAASHAAVTPDGCCMIASAGGTITAAGTVSGDGTVATNSSAFRLFTVAGSEVRAGYSAGTITAGVGETKIASISAVHASATTDSILTSRAFAIGTVHLRGITSASASGPGTVPRGGEPVAITFSGIKDSAGNTVPDGTMVGVTAANQAGVTSDGCCWIFSVGGTIEGGTATNSTHYKAFPVINGSVTVTYRPPNTAGTARIYIVPARPNATLIESKSLIGGVWAIVVQ